MKRFTIMAIAAAALVLIPQRPATTSAQSSGQIPPGPTTVHRSALEINAPPAPLDVVQTVLDFAPGAWTPPHSHGGQVLITVLEGSMTVRRHDGEVTFATGETWVEQPGDVHQAGNTGNVRARLLVTFILAVGAPLTTVEQRAGGELPPGPTTVTRSSLRLVDVPSVLDLVQVQLDFAPGAWTPAHWHGGTVLITVIAGEITVRQHGSERTFKAGELWVEHPNQVHAAGNQTDSTATLAVTFLMPKGGRLTTVVP